jgi:hypothetical protein
VARELVRVGVLEDDHRVELDAQLRRHLHSRVKGEGVGWAVGSKLHLPWLHKP